MTGFAVPTGSTFLFIGDSITDCDRMTYAAPLGSGYVRRFTELVTFHHPELDIRWLNHGVGGDVIGDLCERWQEDVVGHEPDWLAIQIGINDCHGNIEGSDEWAVSAYEDDYQYLLEQVRPFSPNLVLLDPFYVATADGPWPIDDFQRRIRLLGLDAGEQLGDPQLVGPHAVQGRDRAVQDVVAPRELSRSLDGSDVLGPLDHADQ